MKVVASSAKAYLVKTLQVSNKEAITIIAQRRMKINEKDASSNQPIVLTDQVELDGKIIKSAERYTYLAYYKPRGIETTLNTTIQNNLSEALNFPERVFPAGRLDKDSEGLLLLTNDGYTFERIINSQERQEKEYLVTVDKILTEECIHMLRSGIRIMGKTTRAAVVNKINDYTFQMILTQGLNRQIRRMCYKLGYEVTTLKRIRISQLLLGELPVGQWRRLTKEEMSQLP